MLCVALAQPLCFCALRVLHAAKTAVPLPSSWGPQGGDTLVTVSSQMDSAEKTSPSSSVCSQPGAASGPFAPRQKPRLGPQSLSCFGFMILGSPTDLPCPGPAFPGRGAGAIHEKSSCLGHPGV